MTGPRLAFVLNSLEGGGAERVASLLLAAFEGPLKAEFCFETHLVLLDEAPRKYPVPAGVPVHVADARGGLPRSVLGVSRILRRIQPDVCLSFLTRANLATVLCGRNLPVVISERVNTSSHFGGGRLHDRIGKALVRLLYPRADLVVAVSRGVAADLAANFAVSPARTVVVHNPYDVAGVRLAAQEPPPAGLRLDQPFFVAVGRLTRNKNVSLLLDAFAASGSSRRLVVLGDGEDRAALEARAAALGLGDRVAFPGFVANPFAIVARADAFLSASDAEGFPNAAAEAMALGRPVAMTDCPSGPAELLEGQAPRGAGLVRARFGLLTPRGDRDALAEAIRALEDAGLRAELGALAAARLGELAPAPTARRYAEAIMRAVGDGAGRRRAAAAGSASHLSSRATATGEQHLSKQAPSRIFARSQLVRKFSSR